MKKRICVKLCFICLMFSYAIPAFGQYLNKTYELDSAAYGEWGWNIQIQNNSELFIYGNGWRVNSNLHNYSLILNSDASSIIGSRIYGINNSNFYCGNYGTMKRLKNGNYGIAGAIQTFPSNQLGNYSASASFFQIKPNGDSISLFRLTDTSIAQSVYYDFAELSDSTVVMGGFSECNFTLCLTEAKLEKLSFNGDRIWQKSISKVAGQGAIINSIQALGGDTLLVGAVSHYPKQVTYRNQTQYYTKSDPWFILMDTAGNILYDTLLNVGFASMRRIMRDPLGGYFFWGHQDSFYAYSPLDSENLPGYVAHLDNNFRIDWIKTLAQTQGLRYVYMMRPLADGSLLAVGAQQIGLAPGSFAMKLDRRTGNNIWFHTYGEPSFFQSYLVDFVERSDKSLVMTGTYRDTSLPAWHQNDVWVVGVDSNGCEMPGCSFVGVPAAPLPPAAEFRVWPNPSTGVFNVESEEPGTLTIFSIDGRRVAFYTIKAGKTVGKMPTEIPGGVYILQFHPSSGAVGHIVKLVYQAK